ncbi:MAG: PEP-CTERM sorting domain-containing protein [Planctomycetia bacterium]|nr:PEP-CTERM sorting domain-containing protein [Planctomycetia bacterium]
MIRTTLIASFVFALLITPPASAALIAYEPFDDAPVGSDVQGKAGGLGFSGGWRAGGFNASISNNFDIANGSPTFGNLLREGNSVSTPAVGAISGITRDLASPLGQADSTVYLSFLIQPQGALHGGAFNGFMGLTLESAGEPELYVGKPGGGAIDRWALEDRGGSRQHASSVLTQSGSTALLVVKAELFASPNINDKFTLYVNPTPGEAEPASGIVKQDAAFGVVQGMTLYSSGAMQFDELRIGQTFADVTPVPEPGSFGLLTVGFAAFAAAIWRRRK